MTDLTPHLRFSTEEDLSFLIQWLKEGTTRDAYPVTTDAEIEDCARFWLSFHRIQASLTAEMNQTPCGIATLIIHPYQKLAHHCELSMIVDPAFRGQGVGGALLNNLIHLAKNQFKLELLTLHVYENNPAIHLYQRFGFEEFGRQEKWIKENGKYTGRINMVRKL